MSSPEFKDPPVSEVVCGVHFQVKQRLRTVDIGRFWSRIRQDFPKVEEQQPLFDLVGDRDQVFDIPPIRRVWMISDDAHWLIQLQENRFYLNWRKLEGSAAAPYPRYPTVLNRFQQMWSDFKQWLNEEKIDGLEELKYELTYVNHVPFDDTLLRPYHAMTICADPRSDVLGDPKSMSGNVAFDFGAQGQLLVTYRELRRTKDAARILQIDLTAAGAAGANPKDWFDFAHNKIVFGFVDLTTPKAREKWGYERSDNA
ncbi:MAG TPA: TIGR04255 family protein [Planctomycetota bacterium]|nr:TIGR04255 family protein [Planctomycetota bacterium]